MRRRETAAAGAAALTLILSPIARAGDPDPSLGLPGLLAAPSVPGAATAPVAWSAPGALDGPPAHADAWSSGRPDGHAPIGVMGDHVHHAGEWMFSYRAMFMDMDGNRSGSSRVSDADVLSTFAVTPTSMTMEMHMLGAMYALSDDWTLMAMVPWVKKEMDHVLGPLSPMPGATFTTKSEGLGDVRLSALATVWRGERQQAHLNLGLSVPTGSIDEKDDNALSGGVDVQLPYPMQLGSGTFDLMPGITYLGQTDELSWGAQAVATLRTGENDNDYRLGSRQEATAWIARRLTRGLSASFRLGGATWSDIHGQDPQVPIVNGMTTPIVPTADPKLRGGTRIDASLGVNLHASEGRLAGHRLALEVGFPVFQHLDGPQLETDLIVTLGWQLSL